jgi:hypothetical protein
MPDLPTNILSQLVNLPHELRPKQAYLTAVDLADGETPPWATSDDTAIAFQYWPETVQDTRPSEWTPRQIPGGSHPIYQWTSGGERAISFTAIFTTDTDPGEENINLPNAYIDKTQGSIGRRDLDIRSAISWLRYFTYPRYPSGEDLRAQEPPKCQLHLPNSQIGYDGESYVLCVMTQCDVTYEAFFPNGFPRIAEVALSFSEVVQSRSGVRFHSRSRMLPGGGMKAAGALDPLSGNE